MARYAKLAATPVPQSEPLNEKQVENNAGGYVFELSIWDRLDRFLVLGSDSNTYYQKAVKLTRENTGCVLECYVSNYVRTVTRIVEISKSGRAPKNDAAIFALALGASYTNAANEQFALQVRKHALGALPDVCRISTHLFQFVDCVCVLGKGWGPVLRRAVSYWYNSRTVDEVAYQAIKYRSRENYTHKRLMQTAHPKADSKERIALYRWLRGLEVVSEELLPDQVLAHLLAMRKASSWSNVKDKQELISLIEKYKLPWEALPTECTKDPDIWRAMLPFMGMTALIRNLGGMTQYGTLSPFATEVRTVVERLGDREALCKARIHPFNLLMAHAVYTSGSSVLGQRTWTPIAQISDALEQAFYLSFQYIKPSGKRTLIALDVSGSMSSPLMGSPLEVCAGAAAMAMTTARTEENYLVMAFAKNFRKVNITARSTLNEVLRQTRNQNFGATDCSLPMSYALKRKLPVDVFVVYTDNETWAGREHPVRTLEKYRQTMGINAKLVVVGMVSTGFTIADPSDVGMLDVVGFDSAAPALIADFASR